MSDVQSLGCAPEVQLIGEHEEIAQLTQIHGQRPSGGYSICPAPEQHVAFAARWGDLQIAPSAVHLPGHNALIEITHGGPSPKSDGKVMEEIDEAERLARTDNWHTDMSFMEQPPLGSLLLARSLPPAGGDTMFANQYLAYQTLSPGLKRLLDPLKAVHRGEGTYRVAGLNPADAPATLHPVVRTHPETGRRALYVNRVSTWHFEGMTVEESRPLLDYLYEHAAHHNFTFRHRWTAGDLLMWDNRCTQHCVIWDFGRQPRTMHRATVLGDRPI